MKTLYLLRHAHAAASQAGLPDHERPLDARGERDAAQMGARWALRLPPPDKLISSSAVRALATARIVAKAFGGGPTQVAVEARLYDAQPKVLLEAVAAQDDALDGLMLVGHNPEMTELAQHFGGASMHMTPCALAIFRFDVDRWADLVHAMPANSEFDSPERS
jgi:phosphohistidine phosphatase